MWFLLIPYFHRMKAVPCEKPWKPSFYLMHRPCVNMRKHEQTCVNHAKQCKIIVLVFVHKHAQTMQNHAKPCKPLFWYSCVNMCEHVQTYMRKPWLNHAYAHEHTWANTTKYNKQICTYMRKHAQTCSNTNSLRMFTLTIRHAQTLCKYAQTLSKHCANVA
jgi:hypothetical protein